VKNLEEVIISKEVVEGKCKPILKYTGEQSSIA